MGKLTRRGFLEKTATAGVALLAAPLGMALAAGETPHDKKLFNKYFRVAVSGLTDKLPGVVSIDPGHVKMRIAETTQGDQPDYRTFTYGSHSYGPLVMVVQEGWALKALRDWAGKAMGKRAKGAAATRDVFVYALARDKKTVLKTFKCFGCRPRSLKPVTTSHGTKAMRLVCSVARVEAW